MSSGVGGAQVRGVAGTALPGSATMSSSTHRYVLLIRKLPAHTITHPRIPMAIKKTHLNCGSGETVCTLSELLTLREHGTTFQNNTDHYILADTQRQFEI